MIVYILRQLDKIYDDLSPEATLEQYAKVANLIIDNCSDLKQAKNMLQDRCLNGYDVIDVVAYGDLQSILDNNTVSIIINDMWKGPYNRKHFMEVSTGYQILMTNLSKRKTFYGYVPNKASSVLQKVRSFDFSSRHNQNYAHFFKYEVWKKSMEVVFIIDGIIIVILAIAYQYLFLSLLGNLSSQSTQIREWNRLRALLTDSSITEFERYTYYLQFIKLEEELLPEIDQAIDEFTIFIYISIF